MTEDIHLTFKVVIKPYSSPAALLQASLEVIIWDSPGLKWQTHRTLCWVYELNCEILSFLMCVIRLMTFFWCGVADMNSRLPVLHQLNSLPPGRSGFNFKSAIFNLVLLIGIFRSSYGNALKMSWNLSKDKSTLVQVMAWCRQATKPLPEPMLTQICVAIWRH